MNNKKVYLIESTKSVTYGIVAESEEEAISIFNEQKMPSEKFLRIREQMSQYSFYSEKL